MQQNISLVAFSTHIIVQVCTVHPLTRMSQYISAWHISANFGGNTPEKAYLWSVNDAEVNGRKLKLGRETIHVGLQNLRKPRVKLQAINLRNDYIWVVSKVDKRK